MPLSSRQKKHLAGWAIMIIVAGGIGVASRLLMDFGGRSLPTTLIMLLLALLVGAAIIATLPWWRSLDEMQRQAQLAAWYWGGFSGAVLGLFIAILLGGSESELVRGALLMGGVQFACFVVVWIGWRAKHRPPAA